MIRSTNRQRCDSNSSNESSECNDDNENELQDSEDTVHQPIIDDDEDAKPAWIRYMPKLARTKEPQSETHVEVGDVRTEDPVAFNTTIKPSSNRFGPTSLRARASERTSSRLNRISATNPYKQTSGANRNDLAKSRRGKPNISEASELLSMFSIKKPI